MLVTGGHGFLGSHLLEGLKAQGCEKIIAPTHAECDLRDPKAVHSLFKKDSYDLIFHLAASVGGIGANRASPANFFYDNILMGSYVIDGCAKAGIGRLIFLGSICGYPKFAPLPFKEESIWDGYPEETNAPYGIAKRALLVACQAYKQQYGLKFSAVFPTNLYGPRDDFNFETSHVIPAIIRKCEDARTTQSQVVHLWGTGSPSRDFLYVKDVVRGLLLAAEKQEAEGEFMNLGSEHEIKILELAQLIAKKSGFKGEFKWDVSQPDGQPRRCVSNERARKLLGFVPSYDLEKGLEETIHWYRESF